VDGKSLRPLIEDTYNKNETYFAVSEWNSDKVPGFMVRTNTHKLMIASTAEAKNTAIDGLYNLKTDSLEQVNILKLSPVPSAEMAKAQELKVLLIKWLKKVNSPYYYSVKARPIGKLNATTLCTKTMWLRLKFLNYKYHRLTCRCNVYNSHNDTIQITTSNNNPGLISSTVFISGGSTSARFEMMPAFEVQTSIPQQTSFI
jgi:hypothetical protein